MRGDISHRGRKGNFLPGEKEESWKTAIREKEAAKQKQKEVATAEGMSKTLVDGVTFISAKGKFHALWDTLYAKRGHPWENNDWVFVYSFGRIGNYKHS